MPDLGRLLVNVFGINIGMPLEGDVKPLQPPSGEIVLDKPVIPETIVVHDGTPDNASAPNYYVPFKDYIKNVACCEIYSTWPAATIRLFLMGVIFFEKFR